MKKLFKKQQVLLIAGIFLALAIIAEISKRNHWGVESSREKQALYKTPYMNKLKVNMLTNIQNISSELASKETLQDLRLDDVFNSVSQSINYQAEVPNIALANRRFYDPSLYVWLSDSNGNYISGYPAKDFGQIHEVYTSFNETFIKDNYYRTENDFIKSVVGRDFNLQEGYTADGKVAEWRFFDLSKSDKSNAIHYQEEILRNNSGQKIGSISYLVDDRDNYYIFYVDAGVEFYKDYVRYVRLFYIASFLIFIYLLAFWVYWDASDKHMRNPIFWSFLVVLSLSLGVLFYLYTRRSIQVDMSCIHCDTKMTADMNNCPNCGKKQSDTAHCGSCQKEVEPNWLYCPYCQNKLQEQIEA